MKKKLTLISLFSATIILGYLSFISWLLGFITAKFLGGKADGIPGKIKSIVIPFWKYKLHLHHWLICLGVGIFGVAKGIFILSPEVWHGFLGGLVFHGIYYYDDWYKIVRHKR